MLSTATARRRAVTVVFVLAATAWIAPAAAHARALKPPKWLKGPYRTYARTFDASATMDGTETDVIPPPPVSFSTPCDGSTIGFQGAESPHIRLVYRFLFGHSKRGFAFVWRRASLSGGGQASWTNDFSHPAGCPPDPINPDSHESCSAPMGLTPDSPKLDIAGTTRRRRLYLELELMVPGVTPGAYTCAGNGQPVYGPGSFHFSETSTPGGTLVFPASGIKRKRTFSGSVEWIQQEPLANGPGSTTDDIGRQYSWHFNTVKTGSFKLAPAGR